MWPCQQNTSAQNRDPLLRIMIVAVVTAEMVVNNNSTHCDINSESKKNNDCTCNTTSTSTSTRQAPAPTTQCWLYMLFCACCSAGTPWAHAVVAWVAALVLCSVASSAM